MKYLITVSSLTPGSGLSRYIFSLCKILANGNQIIIATTHDNGDNTYAQKELASISTNIILHCVGHLDKRQKYTKLLKFIYIIYPDIIINNYNAVTQYIAPFIPLKTKLVHILHNDTDDFYRVASINGWRVNGWIAPTDSIASHFNTYTNNWYKKRVRVIPHGVEDTRFSITNNKKLEIIYAGVLYEHKGVKILPTIIKTLLSNGTDLHFTIIGGGILDKWLKKQFSSEISNGQVTMTGVIDHNEVYKHMSRGDIFLYPTHLDAFGLVIAEAMINGLVPVVTHLKGITDNLITHGEDGFLVAQDYIETFAENIKKLANDRELLKQLQENAYATAHSRFTLSVMRDHYIKYMQQL